MGTHPIFESDFDCLTEVMIVLGLCHLMLLVSSFVPFGGISRSAHRAQHPCRLFSRKAGCIKLNQIPMQPKIRRSYEGVDDEPEMVNYNDIFDKVLNGWSGWEKR